MKPFVCVLAIPLVSYKTTLVTKEGTPPFKGAAPSYNKFWVR